MVLHSSQSARSFWFCIWFWIMVNRHSQSLTRVMAVLFNSQHVTAKSFILTPSLVNVNCYSTSSCVGAATLTARHRLRIAGMTRVEELQHRINRHVEQYFSIVRRRACCASFVNRSTSVNSTTKTKQLKLKTIKPTKNPQWKDAKMKNTMAQTMRSFFTCNNCMYEWK